jgi:hypothetical protein
VGKSVCEGGEGADEGYVFLGGLAKDWQVKGADEPNAARDWIGAEKMGIKRRNEATVEKVMGLMIHVWYGLYTHPHPKTKNQKKKK